MLPNNAVPPGFRFAQPGEQAALGSIKSAKDKVVKISNKAEVFSLVFVKSKLNGNSN